MIHSTYLHIKMEVCISKVLRVAIDEWEYEPSVLFMFWKNFKINILFLKSDF